MTFTKKLTINNKDMALQGINTKMIVILILFSLNISVSGFANELQSEEERDIRVKEGVTVG